MGKPLIAIVGETASGKSQLAIRLAQEFGGEIIAADSWTVRRGLDIGTAKPSQAEQKLVPHHLLDIVEPCQDFNAAQFKQLAQDKIHEIHDRGKLPLLAGGTGLYIDSVLFDYSFTPPALKKERDEYNRMSRHELLDLAKQRQLDLSSVDTRNKRRVVRALETNGAQPAKKPLRANTCIIGYSRPRAQLNQRIEERVRIMMSSGLEDEVEQLVADYGWDCEGLKGIGYREWQPYFANQVPRQSVEQAIVRSTKQLAKRQRTWFRTNKHIQWCDTYESAHQVMYAYMHKQ